MIVVVVDASVLVAELLRARGRALLTHPDLRCVVAGEQWEEAEHELAKRIGLVVARKRLAPREAGELRDAVHALAA